MAFEKKEIKNGYIFALFLATVLSRVTVIEATNFNCEGKAFYCLNSTHFMICVDLGDGVSQTVNDFVIPCPPPTLCTDRNNFECEYQITTTLEERQSEETKTTEQVAADTVFKDSDSTTIIPFWYKNDFIPTTKHTAFQNALGEVNEMTTTDNKQQSEISEQSQEYVYETTHSTQRPNPMETVYSGTDTSSLNDISGTYDLPDTVQYTVHYTNSDTTLTNFDENTENDLKSKTKLPVSFNNVATSTENEKYFNTQSILTSKLWEAYVTDSLNEVVTNSISEDNKFTTLTSLLETTTEKSITSENHHNEVENTTATTQNILQYEIKEILQENMNDTLMNISPYYNNTEILTDSGPLSNTDLKSTEKQNDKTRLQSTTIDGPSETIYIETSTEDNQYFNTLSISTSKPWEAYVTDSLNEVVINSISEDKKFPTLSSLLETTTEKSITSENHHSVIEHTMETKQNILQYEIKENLQENMNDTLKNISPYYNNTEILTDSTPLSNTDLKSTEKQNDKTRLQSTTIDGASETIYIETSTEDEQYFDTISTSTLQKRPDLTTEYFEELITEGLWNDSESNPSISEFNKNDFSITDGLVNYINATNKTENILQGKVTDNLQEILNFSSNNIPLNDTYNFNLSVNITPSDYKDLNEYKDSINKSATTELPSNFNYLTIPANIQQNDNKISNRVDIKIENLSSSNGKNNTPTISQKSTIIYREFTETTTNTLTTLDVAESFYGENKVTKKTEINFLNIEEQLGITEAENVTSSTNSLYDVSLNDKESIEINSESTISFVELDSSYDNLRMDTTTTANPTVTAEDNNFLSSTDDNTLQKIVTFSLQQEETTPLTEMTERIVFEDSNKSLDKHDISTTSTDISIATEHMEETPTNSIIDDDFYRSEISKTSYNINENTGMKIIQKDYKSSKERLNSTMDASNKNFDSTVHNTYQVNPNNGELNSHKTTNVFETKTTTEVFTKVNDVAGIVSTLEEELETDITTDLPTETLIYNTLNIHQNNYESSFTLPSSRLGTTTITPVFNDDQETDKTNAVHNKNEKSTDITMNTHIDIHDIELTYLKNVVKTIKTTSMADLLDNDLTKNVTLPYVMQTDEEYKDDTTMNLKSQIDFTGVNNIQNTFENNLDTTTMLYYTDGTVNQQNENPDNIFERETNSSPNVDKVKQTDIKGFSNNNVSSYVKTLDIPLNVYSTSFQEVGATEPYKKLQTVANDKVNIASESSHAPGINQNITSVNERELETETKPSDQSNINASNNNGIPKMKVVIYPQQNGPQVEMVPFETNQNIHAVNIEYEKIVESADEEVHEKQPLAFLGEKQLPESKEQNSRVKNELHDKLPNTTLYYNDSLKNSTNSLKINGLKKQDVNQAKHKSSESVPIVDLTFLSEAIINRNEVSTRKYSILPYDTKNVLNFSCTNYSRGKYSDQNDCHTFYICVGQLQPVLGICPNNTVFSEILKQCTRNLSHCVRKNQFKCLTSGRYIDIYTQNTYYICQKNHQHFIRFKLKCLKGYHLNNTSITCVEDISVSTSKESHSTESISSSSSDSKSNQNRSQWDFACDKEGVFPDINDCKKYYVCKKDSGEFRHKRKECDSDEIFHKGKKKCVDEDSYECN